MIEPRNWKWMAPAGVGLVLFVLWGALPAELGAWLWIPLGLALICALAALMNFWLYLAQGYGDVVNGLLSARYQTPEVRMFEAAKGMHPEAVRLLLTQRRIVWLTRYVAQKDLVDWRLDEAPSVHVGFVRFILEHSTSTGLMAKRLLSENSYSFDPDAKVTDRQQYDDLVVLLQSKLIVTQAFGNQAPQFIPPWKPEALLWRFGIVNSDEVEEEGKSATEARARSAVEERLPKVSPPADKASSLQMNTFGGRDREHEPAPLTDVELEAITAETKRYKSLIK